MMSSADAWGVPDSMFGGPVPDDFAAGIARVVLLSSLLESKVHGLLSAMSADPQAKWAGRPIDVLVAEIERLTDSGMPARPHASAALLSAIRAEVIGVRDAIRRRNELLHGIWPFPRLNGGLGWKLEPRKRRRRDWEWMSKLQTNEDNVRSQIEALVSHVYAIDELRQEVETLERVLPPAVRADGETYPAQVMRLRDS
jgi:hypothetical protein